jgi:hypothetical protein
MADDGKILNLILENMKEFKTDVKEDIKNLRVEINSKFDNLENAVKEIKEDMVKKNECKEAREGCTKLTELEVVKSEWSYKKIIAVGGVITATLTGSTVAITTILKAIYG